MYPRSRVPQIVCLVALCALAAQGRAQGQDKPANPIEVHVDSLLASDAQGSLNALPVSNPLSRRLSAVFDYSNYRLLKHEDEETECGGAVAFNLPGGRILHVAPLEVEGDMVAMELVLFEGAHAMLRTELKMVQDGALILVGPRDPGQTFITTIVVQLRGKQKQPAAQPSVASPSESAIDINPAAPPE